MPSVFTRMFASTKYLERGLDASALRNQVIQNNIANAETPNFKSSSVAFELVFREALETKGRFSTKTTRPQHSEFTSSLDHVSGAVVKNAATTTRMDGNNVDIDFQNAELAKNAIYYEALIEKVNSEFRQLNMAIREGR